MAQLLDGGPNSPLRRLDAEPFDFALVHSQEWLCHGTSSSQRGCRRYQTVTHLSLRNALEEAAVFDEDAAGGVGCGHVGDGVGIFG